MWENMNLMRCRGSPASLALLVVIWLTSFINAELPQELDPFLEKLFATEECEEFISDASFLSVSTRECKPFTCEFPHQLCMRPAASYGDEKANQCRDLPQTCLTAANGGVTVPRIKQQPLQGKSSPFNRPRTEITAGVLPEQTTGTEAVGLEFRKQGGTGETLIPSGIEAPQPQTKPHHRTQGPTQTGGHERRQHFGPICEQGVPDGRFCGFELKYTFNRETRRCEQFWYPGCTTENTNDNLFGFFEQCQMATNHCSSGGGGNSGGGLGAVHGIAGGNAGASKNVKGGFELLHGGMQNRHMTGAENAGGFLSSGASSGGDGSNNIPEQIVSIGRSLNSKHGGGGGGGGGGPAGQNVVSTFSQLLTGSALGSGGGASGGGDFMGKGSSRGSSEYGGGALGTGGGDNGAGGGVTQPPNFIRLIANTIREVGSAQQQGKGGAAAAGAVHGGKGARAAELLNRFDPGQFANIFQSLPHSDAGV